MPGNTVSAQPISYIQPIAPIPGGHMLKADPRINQILAFHLKPFTANSFSPPPLVNPMGIVVAKIFDKENKKSPPTRSRRVFPRSRAEDKVNALLHSQLNF